MYMRHFVILAIFFGLIGTPVMADVKYLTGDPDLSASVAGRNEFSPGEDVVLKVNIENRGLIDMKFVRSGIVERDDLPSTAKLVKAGRLRHVVDRLVGHAGASVAGTRSKFRQGSSRTFVVRAAGPPMIRNIRARVTPAAA